MATVFALVCKGILAVLLVAAIPFGVAFAVLIWTGETLRYFFSFGRHRPAWGITAFMKKGWSLELASQLSMYLGVAFWLFVLVLVKNL